MIDTVIKGNPDLLRTDELHKSAWDILEPHFQAAQAEAVAHYQQLAGQASERVADTLEKIVPAAYDGRVETLFVAAGVQQWGVFNPVTNEIEIHDQMESGDEPLLDLAAVQTYLKGGISLRRGTRKSAGRDICCRCAPLLIKCHCSTCRLHALWRRSTSASACSG